MTQKAKPGIYIPTLYIAEGLPYTMVNLMSVVFFKTMGATNQFIGLTSFLYIPWTVKLFWAPFVDLISTRRNWILICQFVLAALSAVLALAGLTAYAISAAVAVFVLLALVSATQDIAIDGYYLDVLDRDQQALYVGIRNAAYKVAWLLGSGGLVYVAGRIGESAGINTGWAVVFAICAFVFLLAALFHLGYLPFTEPVKTQRDNIATGRFADVFSTYFKQKKIAAIVFYILTFRLGDALMLKMAQPFLLDKADLGGLGLSVAQVGLIYGTVGTVFLLIGGLLGGWLISRQGLRRWFFPTAIIQNSAILLYWVLSFCKPNVAMVAAVNSIEQFSYGLGVAAYTVFLLSTVKNEEYRAAHYAIATALMALGVMIPGAASGYLQGLLGYSSFFLTSFIAAIPGMVAIFFLPLPDKDSPAQ